MHTRPACSVEGCPKPHCAKGYCKAHYYRLRRTGELDVSQFRSPDGRCTVPGCVEAHLSRGLCSLHYGRRRRTGSVGGAKSGRRRRSIGDKRVNADGYVMVFRPDHPSANRAKEIGEHRLVMEGALGRALHPFETAHHKNGIRTDNSPSNLELWVTPQPPGQRPEDLAAWVCEHYPEIVASEMRARRRDLPTR